MKKNRLPLLAGAIFASLSSGAMAQVHTPIKPTYEIPGGEVTVDENAPRGIALQEGLSLYPSLALSYGRDDNLFLANVNKRSSNVYSVAPGLKLQARSAASIYTLDYEGKSARYENSRADDYNDYHFGGTGEFVFSSRIGLRLGVDYDQGHDARGSTDRVGGEKPDLYRISGVSGLFAFGGNDARGRVELEAGSSNKRYKNNRTTTFASDRDTDNLAGRFFARVAPKTSLLVEARVDKLDYSSTTSVFDSKEYRYLVGVTWDATAATSGTVKVGQIRKEFTSASIRDFSGTGWDANVQWAPRTYSRLGLSTAKTFGESTGLGDFILTKRYGATWTHDWNSRLSTIANIGRAEDDFTNNVRSDSTDSIGFRVDYKVRRWLTIGGEFSNAERDSNISTFRYKKNIYTLSLAATL